MRMTKHFTTEEFSCNCACGAVEMDGMFITQLEKARKVAAIPFRITSGYRCSTQNERVGGVDAWSRMAPALMP